MKQFSSRSRFANLWSHASMNVEHGVATVEEGENRYANKLVGESYELDVASISSLPSRMYKIGLLRRYVCV